MLPTSRNERNMDAVKIEQRYLKISSTSFGFQANFTQWILHNSYLIFLKNQKKKKRKTFLVPCPGELVCSQKSRFQAKEVYVGTNCNFLQKEIFFTVNYRKSSIRSRLSIILDSNFPRLVLEVFEKLRILHQSFF